VPSVLERLLRSIAFSDLGSQDTQVTVTGTTPEYISVRNSAVAQGQFLSDVDVRNNRVSALGAETARCLARPHRGESPHRNLSFRVIGSWRRRAVLGRNQDEAVFVPLQQWLTSYRRTSRRSPTVQSVSARDQASTSAAQFQITNLLRLRHKIGAKMTSPFAVSRTCGGQCHGILILMLATTASISLLVRHRHYEHHAGVGDRAHSGNWPAQSD